MHIHQNTKIETFDEDLGAGILLISTIGADGRPIVQMGFLQATSPDEAHGLGTMLTLGEEDVQHLFDAMQAKEKCVIRTTDKQMTLLGYMETHRDDQGLPYKYEYMIEIDGMRTHPEAGIERSKIAFRPGGWASLKLLGILDHNISLAQELNRAPAP